MRLTAEESGTIRDYRWWSFDEIKNSDETIPPEKLAENLDKILFCMTEPVDISDNEYCPAKRTNKL